MDKMACLSPKAVSRYTTLLAIGWAFTACATKPPPEPVIITKTVSVEVVRPCAATKPVRPDFQASDTALRGMNDAADRYQALLADNPLVWAYMGGLENVLTACGVK